MHGFFQAIVVEPVVIVIQDAEIGRHDVVFLGKAERFFAVKNAAEFLFRITLVFPVKNLVAIVTIVR